MTTTPLKAKAEVLRLHAEGKSLKEIYDAMTARGTKGPRGKPIGASTLASWIQSSTQRRRSPRPTAKAAATRKGSRSDQLQAIRSILSLKIDAEERINLALMVLK